VGRDTQVALICGEDAVGSVIDAVAAARGNKEIVRIVSVERVEGFGGGGGSEHYGTFWGLGGVLGPGPICASMVFGSTVTGGAYPGPPGTVVAHLVSRATTIKNLRGRVFGPPGMGNSLDITLLLGGGLTALTINFAGAVDEASDLVNTVPVVPGNKIGWRFDYAGGPPEVDFAMLTWEET